MAIISKRWRGLRTSEDAQGKFLRNSQARSASRMGGIFRHRIGLASSGSSLSFLRLDRPVRGMLAFGGKETGSMRARASHQGVA